MLSPIFMFGLEIASVGRVVYDAERYQDRQQYVKQSTHCFGDIDTAELLNTEYYQSQK